MARLYRAISALSLRSACLASSHQCRAGARVYLRTNRRAFPGLRLYAQWATSVSSVGTWKYEFRAVSQNARLQVPPGPRSSPMRTENAVRFWGTSGEPENPNQRAPELNTRGSCRLYPAVSRNVLYTCNLQQSSPHPRTLYVRTAQRARGVNLMSRGENTALVSA